MEFGMTKAASQSKVGFVEDVEKVYGVMVYRKLLQLTADAPLTPHR